VARTSPADIRGLEEGLVIAEYQSIRSACTMNARMGNLRLLDAGGGRCTRGEIYVLIPGEVGESTC
jgi:hypothetical protein